MEQTFKSSDFVLHCSAAYWESAIPPTVNLPIALDSLLCQSYLSESGQFSVSRIVALLLFDLVLDCRCLEWFDKLSS